MSVMTGKTVWTPEDGWHDGATTVWAWPGELVSLMREGEVEDLELIGTDGTARLVLDIGPAFSPAHVSVRFEDEPTTAYDLDRSCQVLARFS